MKVFTVGPNDAGQRLDKFAEKATASLPRSLMSSKSGGTMTMG